MNISDLKKMKNDDLKNLIKKYKKSNCPPYSKLKKSDLVDLIVKLKIKPVRTIPEKKSPVKKSPVKKSPAPKSPVRQDDFGIVDKTIKEKLLKKVAKIISKTKKDLNDIPKTAGPRMNKTDKEVKLEQKLDELLDIQKYLNNIYRDNITEKVSKKKVELILK